MNKLIRILCMLLIVTMPAMAQEEELGTENAPTMGDVPIDGGLSLLLAAGAAIGGRKLYRDAAKKRQGT